MTGRTLDDIRADIDRLDRDEIMQLLARRLGLARQVGECKGSAGMPIVDREREGMVLDSFARHMSDNGMPPECGVGMARALIDAAIIAERGGTTKLTWPAQGCFYLTAAYRLYGFCIVPAMRL